MNRESDIRGFFVNCLIHFKQKSILLFHGIRIALRHISEKAKQWTSYSIGISLKSCGTDALKNVELPLKRTRGDRVSTFNEAVPGHNYKTAW